MFKNSENNDLVGHTFGYWVNKETRMILQDRSIYLV